MRVVVAGPSFAPWDLETYVRAVLERRGAAVRAFAYGRIDADADVQRALLATCRTFRPNLLFGLKLDRIAPSTLRAVRRVGARVLLWYVDCFEPAPPAWLGARVRQCDALFVSAKGLIPAYRELGPTPVHWAMEGAYLPAFPPLEVSAPQRRLFGSQVAFVGSVYHPTAHADDFHARARLLRRIGARYELKIWGPQRFPATRRRLGRGLTLVKWPAYNRDLVRICRSSRIVLGINLINSIELYFSNRTFLTLAAGGFHLTHYVPGLETLFRNHEHLVWFRGEDECLDLIAHYLARPAKAAAIAARGRALVRRRFSLARQVGRILRLAGVSDA
jgi:hypothetical protein